MCLSDKILKDFTTCIYKLKIEHTYMYVYICNYTQEHTCLIGNSVLDPVIFSAFTTTLWQ